jgi:hypothetical protein
LQRIAVYPGTKCHQNCQSKHKCCRALRDPSHEANQQLNDGIDQGKTDGRYFMPLVSLEVPPRSPGAANWSIGSSGKELTAPMTIFGRPRGDQGPRPAAGLYRISQSSGFAHESLPVARQNSDLLLNHANEPVSSETCFRGILLCCCVGEALARSGYRMLSFSS